jgi:hypothetical protein
MKNALTLLNDFIEDERKRFCTRDNNVFAFSLGHVCRYLTFLNIIEGRYSKVGQLFVANSNELRAAVPSGTPKLTDEQRRLLDEGTELTFRLHLEIESFYLFAKILLDKVAHAIEFYFGAVRGVSLDSHDDLVKCLDKYAKGKRLNLPTNFVEKARSLKKDVSDFRDYEIAHEKSPRRLNITGFSADGHTSLISSMLYPTEKDQQVSSKHLGDLGNEIEEYVQLLTVLLGTNRELTQLKVQNTIS